MFGIHLAIIESLIKVEIYIKMTTLEPAGLHWDQVSILPGNQRRRVLPQWEVTRREKPMRTPTARLLCHKIHSNRLQDSNSARSL